MKRRQSADTIFFLAGFLVLVLAALFVISLSSTALALRSQQQSERGSLKGEIVAVDTMNHVRTVTLRSSAIGKYPNDEVNVFLNNDTKINVCNAKEPYGDLKTGKNAVIMYQEIGGVPVARSVSEQC